MSKIQDAKAAEAGASPGPADMETNYQPINWKKILFTPKYIRMYHISLVLPDMEEIEKENNKDKRRRKKNHQKGPKLTIPSISPQLSISSA